MAKFRIISTFPILVPESWMSQYFPYLRQLLSKSTYIWPNFVYRPKIWEFSDPWLKSGFIHGSMSKIRIWQKISILAISSQISVVGYIYSKILNRDEILSIISQHHENILFRDGPQIDDNDAPRMGVSTTSINCIP